jgi:hypothetical protein
VAFLNTDFAGPADAISEEQTFRNEVNGSLPLSGHRSSVVLDEIQTYNVEVRCSEKDFETFTVGCLCYYRFASRPKVLQV